MYTWVCDWLVHCCFYFTMLTPPVTNAIHVIFSQLHFTAYKNTFFILSLKNKVVRFYWMFLLKQIPGEYTKLLNTAEEISENGVSDRSVDYKITHSSNLIIGECPTYE